jgi:glycine cleavage system H protein
MAEEAGVVLEDQDLEDGIIRYDAEYHMWIRVQDELAMVGITDYAQGQLNEITYVELPEVDTELEREDFLGTVEALKTNVDILAPISGTVVEANEELLDQPELVNSSPYEEGWFVKIQMSDPSELEALIAGAEYREKLSS